jgi:Mg2+-importing ATPase
MMTFLGFVVLSDPLKEGVRETIEELNQLGIDVRIISGDNRWVAAAVGYQVGLPVEDILTGAEIRTMTGEALALRAREVRVFADVEPAQRERIILALRAGGSVVGYMGDGANDAPALHAADVGISVDTAVDVAKEVAQIVLLEKDLGVLARGVQLGRKTFANTMKYVFTTMSANFGNMLSMAGISLILPYLGYAFLPLLPKQILALNFMSDIPATAISTDNVDRNMVERPRRWNIRFITQFMVTFGMHSTVFDFITFGVLLLALHAPELQFQTGWFMMSMVSEILVLMIIRTRALFTRSLPSRRLLGASLVVLVATLLLPFTPLAEVLNLTVLPVGTTVVLALIVLAYVITAEIIKHFFYKVTVSSS